MIYGPIIELLAKVLLQVLTLLGAYLKGRSDERAKEHLAAMELAKRAWKFKATVASAPHDSTTGIRVLGDDTNPIRSFSSQAPSHADHGAVLPPERNSS